MYIKSKNGCRHLLESDLAIEGSCHLARGSGGEVDAVDAVVVCHLHCALDKGAADALTTVVGIGDYILNPRLAICWYIVEYECQDAGDYALVGDGSQKVACG